MSLSDIVKPAVVFTVIITSWMFVLYLMALIAYMSGINPLIQWTGIAACIFIPLFVTFLALEFL